MQIYSTMYLEISGNTNLCIFHNLNKGLFLLFCFIDTMFCYYTKIDWLLIIIFDEYTRISKIDSNWYKINIWIFIFFGMQSRSSDNMKVFNIYLTFKSFIMATCVKVFRINPEFRILRLTFHRKSASKCWVRQILIAFLISFQMI